jgi:hypothetical protein
MSAMSLPFTEFDLGSCKRGDIWRVTLDRGANVFLVDESNFAAFRNDRDFRYYGGLIQRSPHDFVIPSTGRWRIVAHTWGLRDPARVSVAPLPRLDAMPPAAPHLATLQSIAQNAAAYGGEEHPSVAVEQKDFDVFISHASDDKEAIVRPLALALQQCGLKVWFDEFELRLGMSLRRSIDAGLANSRFGVVVLSEAFFGKGWANYELDGLVTREVSGEEGQLILPLWHQVTKDQVIGYSPSLADRLALRTADHTIEEIAEEIADVIEQG